jgi:adenylate kinase
MRKYIIMGPQGCGKGTQARLLAAAYDLVHIGVGEVFRWHVQNHTKLGAKVRRIVARGELVGDDLVDTVVAQRLDQHDWNFGFVLDGFPRNGTQAVFFLERYDVDAVIRLDVRDEVVLDRVLARRLCAACGLDYNLIFHRPRRPDVCDVCKGKLVPRPDDTEDAVRARLRDYHEKTQPILDLFQRKELVVSVDGERSVEAVQEEIRRRLDLPAASRVETARAAGA